MKGEIVREGESKRYRVTQWVELGRKKGGKGREIKQVLEATRVVELVVFAKLGPISVFDPERVLLFLLHHFLPFPVSCTSCLIFACFNVTVVCHRDKPQVPPTF